MTHDQYVTISHDLGIAAFHIGLTRLPRGHDSFWMLVNSVPLTDGPFSPLDDMYAAWRGGFNEARDKWDSR